MIDSLKGNVYRFIGKVLDIFFTILISLSTFLVRMAKGAFGIFGVLLFLGPFAILILFRPILFLLIILFGIISVLGNKGIIYLKYGKYMFTEYFYDRADFYLLGQKVRYETIFEYGNRFWQMEAERKREEARRRQEEAWRRQEEAARRFQEAFFGQWEDFQGSSWQDFNSNNTVNGFSTSFKSDYEKNCDLLGVDYGSSKEEIRTAYRNKAKEYHPDINKAEDATEMFQKINDANSFLTDENIKKYHEKYL